MSIRRGRTVPAVLKPPANAALSLYASTTGIDSDWVRLVLCEKEIDSARITLLAPGAFNEDLALLNPSNSLPTLADREGVLSGAAVIVEYLDERYPHPKLMPASPSEKARLRMALLWIQSDIFPLVASSADSPRDAKALMAALRQALQAAARHAGARGWFLGFDYNLADCAWSVVLRRLGPAACAAEPVFAAYAQRLFARPGFARCFGSAKI